LYDLCDWGKCLIRKQQIAGIEPTLHFNCFSGYYGIYMNNTKLDKNFGTNGELSIGG
jgi:hypothetical protein